MRFARGLIVLTLSVPLFGCNKDDSAQITGDGKATGAACRHAGRAIEDCFTLNPDAQRAAVFDGWKEMNDYMRENKIAELTPQHTPKDEHADAQAHDETDTETKTVAAAEHESASQEVSHESEAPPAEGRAKTLEKDH